MMGDIITGIFPAFVRVHVLHHAAEGRICGVEMIAELSRHGYRLSPGTLYPVLHSLEKAGYVVSQGEVVGGKMRKYYRITPSGRKALAKVRAQLGELVREVLADSASARSRRPVP